MSLEQESQMHQFENRYEPEEPPRANSKKWIILAVVIVVLLALSAGAFAAWHFISKPTPEDLAGRAFTNLAQAKSLSFEASVEGSAGTENSTDVALDFRGKMEFGKGWLSQFAGALDASVMLPDGTSFDLGLESRLLEETVYVRLTKMPPLFAMFGLSGDQWIHIDDIYKQAEQTIGSENIKDQISSQKVRQDIIGILKKHHIAIVTEPFEEMMINDVAVRHLAFVIDQSNLVDAFIEVGMYLQENFTDSESKVSEEEIKREIKELRKELDGIESIAGEMWIGTEKTLLRKLLLVVEGEVEETGPVKTTLVITLDDYGKDFDIQAPPESLSIEQLFGDVFAPEKNTNDAFSGSSSDMNISSSSDPWAPPTKINDIQSNSNQPNVSLGTGTFLK